MAGELRNCHSMLQRSGWATYMLSQLRWAFLNVVTVQANSPSACMEGRDDIGGRDADLC
jgi:hypothetical protein